MRYQSDPGPYEGGGDFRIKGQATRDRSRSPQGSSRNEGPRGYEQRQRDLRYDNHPHGYGDVSCCQTLRLQALEAKPSRTAPAAGVVAMTSMRLFMHNTTFRNLSRCTAVTETLVPRARH